MWMMFIKNLEDRVFGTSRTSRGYAGETDLRFGLWSWTCEFREFGRYTHSSPLKMMVGRLLSLGWLLFRGYVKLPTSTHIFPSIIDDWMLTGVSLGNQMLIFWQGWHWNPLLFGVLGFTLKRMTIVVGFGWKRSEQSIKHSSAGIWRRDAQFGTITFEQKTTALVSIESWLFNRDSYFLVYEIIPIYIYSYSCVVFHLLYTLKETVFDGSLSHIKLGSI